MDSLNVHKNAYSKWVPSPPLGIGEYQKAANIDLKAKEIFEFLSLIFLNATFIAGSVALGIVLPLSLIATIPIAIGVLGCSAPELTKLTLSNAFELYRTVKYKHTLAPSTSNLKYDQYTNDCPKNNQWDSNISGATALKDPIETFNMKKKLIEHAEQEILISGSYCGRKAFDQILDAIEKRMEERENLRVSVLSSTRFITDKKEFGCSNWKKIKNLTEKYPERFFFTSSYESLQNNPYDHDFKYISNHAKVMIVDRKVMITGGSGIEDRWMNHDGLSDIAESDSVNSANFQEKSFINASIAKAFRDKDFLMYADNDKSIIQSSVFEFYKLQSRWDHFERTVKKNSKIIKEIARKRGGHHKLEGLRDFYKPINTTGPRIDIDKLELNQDEVFTPKGVKLFFTGPEMKRNEMQEEIIHLIQNAKKSICINHMYFHPTQKTFDALANALKRNIKVTVITNTYNKNSPRSHKAFAPRSFSHLHKLSKYQKDNNLKIYAWNKKLITNHQKLFMVDDQYLLCGSSNFSYKGLNSMSDYEHNVLIDSTKLCTSLKKHFDLDKAASNRISNQELSKTNNFSNWLCTSIHKIAERKIG